MDNGFFRQEPADAGEVSIGRDFHPVHGLLTFLSVTSQASRPLSRLRKLGLSHSSRSDGRNLARLFKAGNPGAKLPRRVATLEMS
jgi:hypothetical protein